AIEREVIDRALTLDEPWSAEARDADVVLVAAPVAQFPALFAQIARDLGAHTCVTDAGSTKQDVVAAAREAFGARLPVFVPAHPIAGTEHSGAGAAFASLFDNRSVILAPLPETDRDPGARSHARRRRRRVGIALRQSQRDSGAPARNGSRRGRARHRDVAGVRRAGRHP